MGCVVRLADWRAAHDPRPRPPEDEAARGHALRVMVMHGALPPRHFARRVELEARRYQEPHASRWALWVWQLYEEGRT